MSRLLAIETSSEACSVALRIEGQLLVRDYHQPRRHAELLLPAVQSLLDEGDIRLADLDAIAFGRGPGSFTSLRIGIGVVQGLAWGAEVGVVPVSSLAALAQDVAGVHGCGPGDGIVIAMDARMDEVFHARYILNAHGIPALDGDERVSPAGDVQWAGDREWVGAGNGFARYTGLAERRGQLAAVYSELWPTATGLIPTAEAWLANQEPLAAHLAQPLYIRDHVADKPQD